MTPRRALHVLLVEDNPGDVDLVLDALRESSLVRKISVAVDGSDAILLLMTAGPLPDLVILDLNLPKKDGRTVLREMRSDSRLKVLPVVVLSSSAADRDVSDSYDLGANCFVTKPTDVDEFFAAVRSIEDFWLRLARIPPAAAPAFGWRARS